MKKSILIIAAMALLSSCIHKELCFQHPHVIPLEIQFDWKDAPDASPDGMCVYFYPVQGNGGQRFDFKDISGGEIELRAGTYSVLCYNNDTEIVQFYNSNDFDTHGVYTREGSVLEPIYGNTASYAPRAEGTEDERVVICPDMMWGCSVTEITVTDDTEIITLYPHELVCTYTYEVRNVKNIAHLSQMSGTISGMAGTLSFSTEEIGTEPVTLPFGAQSDGQSTITGQFYTFGHHTDNPDPHRMAFYAVMDNGAKYCFKAGDRLDVTEQVHNAPDFRHVHIIIDGLDLPEPIEGGSGYDPAVDDWVVIEEEIIL